MIDKDRISYEIDTKTSELRSEMLDAQYHLGIVNKKLQGAKTDIWLYAGFLVVPPLLSGALFVVCFFFGILIHALLVTVASTIIVLYMLSLPVVVYQLIKYIVIYRMHTLEGDEDWTGLPKEKYKLMETEESNYRDAQRKLQWILMRYYLYEEKLRKLKRYCEKDKLPEDETEIRKMLDLLVFYQIPNASSPFTGRIEKKAKVVTVLLFLGVIVLLVIRSGLLSVVL